MLRRWLKAGFRRKWNSSSYLWILIPTNTVWCSKTNCTFFNLSKSRLLSYPPLISKRSFKDSEITISLSTQSRRFLQILSQIKDIVSEISEKPTLMKKSRYAFAEQFNNKPTSALIGIGPFSRSSYSRIIANDFWSLTNVLRKIRKKERNAISRWGWQRYPRCSCRSIHELTSRRTLRQSCASKWLWPFVTWINIKDWPLITLAMIWIKSASFSIISYIFSDSTLSVDCFFWQRRLAGKELFKHHLHHKDTRAILDIRSISKQNVEEDTLHTLNR